jgi:hypothetical protein
MHSGLVLNYCYIVSGLCVTRLYIRVFKHLPFVVRLRCWVIGITSVYYVVQWGFLSVLCEHVYCD